MSETYSSSYTGAEIDEAVGIALDMKNSSGGGNDVLTALEELQTKVDSLQTKIDDLGSGDAEISAKIDDIWNVSVFNRQTVAASDNVLCTVSTTETILLAARVSSNTNAIGSFISRISGIVRIKGYLKTEGTNANVKMSLQVGANSSSYVAGTETYTEVTFDIEVVPDTIYTIEAVLTNDTTSSKYGYCKDVTVCGAITTAGAEPITVI